MNSLQQSLILSFFVSASLALPVSAADVKAGEQKADHCASCHGQKGNSSNAQWPNLAAQSSIYLVNQLKAFKSGDRVNPIMQPMASHLSDEDINDLSAYFSSQQPVKAGGEPTLAKAGETKAAMCLGCHGAKAQGNGQFPRLAGQYPEYLERQLNAFKTGTRKNGPMQAIAANLSEADFKALAAYFASL
ncbi:c-type cytochrome [Candidatus Methylobacter oryzae]|uniref:Cytochrome c n=1 Tax=Candidatus Methylobacter oryzae TaxID=2497749 RepID=A0ABY3CHL5_9GAMM|nr:cytochrome c [Candidatus Methylobacter oryzae]TRX03836.1 cytochrome c [Candidatus Methylobacter oryzae]